jgi:uncharacterized membrane protein
VITTALVLGLFAWVVFFLATVAAITEDKKGQDERIKGVGCLLAVAVVIGIIGLSFWWLYG